MSTRSPLLAAERLALAPMVLALVAGVIAVAINVPARAQAPELDPADLSRATPASLATSEAPQIALALTEEEIRVTARFSGAQLHVYGVARGAGPRDDIVVILRGPVRDVMAQRKERVAGVWLNGPPARFAGAPAYYAAASTRDLALIAPPDTLRREAIGVDHIALRVEGDRAPQAAALLSEYRRAILRQKIAKGLYRAELGQVDRLDAGLFRASVTVPAGAPTGSYRADAYLMRAGRIVSQSNAELSVRRAGLERGVYEMAHTRPLLYGLMAVFLALVSGVAAAAAFNRR